MGVKSSGQIIIQSILMKCDFKTQCLSKVTVDVQRHSEYTEARVQSPEAT